MQRILSRWTLAKSSDAMWRIYSPDKKSIRIRTTIGQLFDSLNVASVETACCIYSIGKVEYFPKSKLIKKARSTFETDGNLKFGNMFKSLLDLLRQNK